ncbi:MAG: NAD(+)/NADH kinase [Candidatus Cryptobacteroides sp.]
MNIALYIKKERLFADRSCIGMIKGLEQKGAMIYRVRSASDLRKGTELLLSVGGDGTFLSAAALVGNSGIPVMGVNFGRMGFLSENRPESVPDAIAEKKYVTEDRSLLEVRFPEGMPEPPTSLRVALNEVSVHRIGAAMLGVDVCIDGTALPTYWADGLLVATSSGSTAYSLSVGGPIVLPEARVLIIAPIAPHNMNVRPLIVPDTSEISLSFRSRDGRVMLTVDNRNAEISSEMKLAVSMAQFSLKRVRLNDKNFINALTEKLFWGEDIRNSTDN